MILRLARLKPCISPPSRPNSSLSHPNRAFFHSSHPLSCRSHWPNGESRSACNSRVMALIRAHKLDEARCVLESLSLNNVRTWTSLLTSYAQIGRVQEARQVFDAMPEKNIISWNSMLTGYVKNSNLQNARKLFDEMPEKNVASWNAMISGYCRMGLMREARELFELMGGRNLVTWTSLISGYAEAEDYIEGWILFLRMRRDGAVLDQPGFVVGVTVASGLARIDPVQLLQGMVTKAGFDQDVIVCTSILNTYAKLGELEAAVLFYNGMPIKNEFTWATMITCYAENGKLEYACEIYRSTPGQTVGTQTAMMVGFAQNGRIFEARAIFDEILKPDVVAWNAMVTGYAQNGLVEQAEEMFNKMPKRNSVSWASMVSGYSQNGLYKKALQLFSEMLRTGMVPINPACTSAINTCASSGALQLGKQIHTLSIKIGSFSNRFLSHALIDMYSRCKNIDDAVQVFSLMREKDNISWNSLISGLSQNQMLEDARSAFETMPNHDIVSWTTMICAYVLAGHACEAQELFTCLLRDGLKPNPFTFSSILTNCAGLGAMELGKQIHGLALKLWFDNDIYVSTALINMYFKCGSIIEAFQVFDEAPEHDLAMWNSVLTGCGQHALGRQAVRAFEEMRLEGVKPDQTTFAGLLCACGHVGLIEEAYYYFDSMHREHGIMPQECHYASIVGLLGQAGQLYEAEEFIESMPFEPGSLVFGALLKACRAHVNVELGQRIAERLFSMEPNTSSSYVLLLDIYKDLGMWKEVGEMKKLMKDRGVDEEASCSMCSG